jgi:uncharacterized protein (TIGR02677 family)
VPEFVGGRRYPRPVRDRELTPFSYLTAPNAGLYRQVMLAFVEAKRRFTVHLRPEDVHDSLDRQVDPAAVTDALEKLESWGNLRSDPDTSRVTTVEDFHRARFLYQLTKQGEAVEEALAAYDEALGRRGALQAVALTDIATQLRALRELLPDPDPAKVHLLLRGLVDRFTDLAGNAQAFMGSLQRSIDLHDADEEAFRAYKDRLIDYLRRFIADLVATGADIAELVLGLEQAGVGRLLDIAAWREAEDAAPGAADGINDARQEEYERGRALWHDRWHGFRGWFISSPHHPSQAKLLRAQARAAIPQLLAVVATLNERRAGHSDRAADFRTLALWFAEAPDDAARHELWRAAFGLGSARHLSVDAATLAARAETPVAATTPWADAPPLEISPRLRKTGSYERRGRPNRVLDRSQLRTQLADTAARQAAETAAARAALATSYPIRLSDIGELPADAFALFLGLLGDVLAARRPGDRAATTTTSDGSMEVRLTALEDTGETATIVTPHGEFHGPDHIVHITDLAGGVEARSA